MKPIDYKKRLAAAADLVGNGAMLVCSQPEFIRNGDTHHAYRQHSSLFYLTGIVEPETTLLIAPHRSQGDRLHLFVRPKDALAELWSGFRLGVDEASKTIPVDAVHTIDEMPAKIIDLLEGAGQLYCELGVTEERDRMLLNIVSKHRRKFGRKSGGTHLPLFDVEAITGPLRLYKSDEEIERMREAARMTALGFGRVLQQLRPGWTERQVHGLLVGSFLEQGAEMEAYPSIVAGGRNACCLHYTENNSPLVDGDLLLIDAGAQFQYYASDVTRTFPVGKTFGPRQRELYEVCLQSQLATLELCKPGGSIPEIFLKAKEVIAEGLIDLGLLKGTVDGAIESGEIKNYFPHGLSHWIGLDVHDPSPYMQDDKPLVFAPGMFFSLEPGIYVQPDNEAVSADWRGIGIRIEDDILITASGYENLTAAIPKSISELENRY